MQAMQAVQVTHVMVVALNHAKLYAVPVMLVIVMQIVQVLPVIIVAVV
jgi:hypothetical protein